MSPLICLPLHHSFSTALLSVYHFLTRYPLLLFLSVPVCCVRWVGKGQRGCWKQSESEGNEPNKSSSCPCLLPARTCCLPSSLQLCTFILLSCRKPYNTIHSKYFIVPPLITIKVLIKCFSWFPNYIKIQNVQATHNKHRQMLSKHEVKRCYLRLENL